MPSDVMTTEELCAALARPENEPMAYLVRTIINLYRERDEARAALTSTEHDRDTLLAEKDARIALRGEQDGGGSDDH